MTTNEPPVGPDPNEPSTPPSTPPPSYGSYEDSGNYPPPPPSGGGYGSPTPFSAPEAIGYGWRKFAANAGNWLLAGLAVLVVGVVFFGLSLLVSPDIQAAIENDGSISTTTSGSRFLSLLVTIAASIVSMIITGVAIRGGLDETDGRKFAIGDALSRVPIGPVVITSIVIGLVTGILQIIPILGAILALIVQFFTWFALAFVVDKGQDAFTAIQSSFSLVSKNAANTLLLAVLGVLLIIASCCTLFLALLVVYPIISIATAYAFRKFQNEPVAD